CGGPVFRLPDRGGGPADPGEPPVRPREPNHRDAPEQGPTADHRLGRDPRPSAQMAGPLSEDDHCPVPLRGSPWWSIDDWFTLALTVEVGSGFTHALHRRVQSFLSQAHLRIDAAVARGTCMQGIPALYDVDARLRVVDSFPDYTQVICLGMPAIDRLTGPEHSPKWARIGNDGLADLVAKYPDRFVGYAASLPMNAPQAAAKEAERVLADGANAIQLHTNVDGAPIDQDQFLPIYEIIEKSGKPILLHPIRTREMADYRTETVSKYEICSVIGWPFETGAALARLVFSGIMDRFPNLKVISHHLGGIIPYFEGRVAHSWIS